MSQFFVILAFDRADTAELRQERREAHLAHFRKNGHKLAIAGPLVGEAAGSLIIIEAEDSAEAERFIKGDPFFKAGIFDRIDVQPFRPSTGRWLED